MRLFNSNTVGKSGIKTALIVVGQYLIYIKGNSSLLGKIAAELKKLE